MARSARGPRCQARSDARCTTARVTRRLSASFAATRAPSTARAGLGRDCPAATWRREGPTIAGFTAAPEVRVADLAAGRGSDRNVRAGPEVDCASTPASSARRPAGTTRPRSSAKRQSVVSSQGAVRRSPSEACPAARNDGVTSPFVIAMSQADSSRSHWADTGKAPARHRHRRVRQLRDLSDHTTMRRPEITRSLCVRAVDAATAFVTPKPSSGAARAR